ncbi:hypothetical protein BLOT_001131 [Blomia tropicalis]|nr:hypothetical protein BLOT_001131 [Blomia tropicalis]
MKDVNQDSRFTDSSRCIMAIMSDAEVKYWPSERSHSPVNAIANGESFSHVTKSVSHRHDHL